MNDHPGPSDQAPVWTKRAADGDVARLEREAAVLAELDGAGVVELEATGDGWLATRTAGRRTLADMAEGRGIESAVALAALAALDEVHQAGWQHGAATLDHGVVAPSGRVRWCSLGDARRIESPADPAARRERAAVEELLADALPRGRRRRRSARAGRAISAAPAAPAPSVHRHLRRARRAVLTAACFASVAAGCFLAFARLAGADAPLDRTARLAALISGLLALYGAAANTVLGIAWGVRRAHVARRVASAVPRWLAWCVVGSTGVAATTAAMGATRPTTSAVEMPHRTPPTTTTTSASTTTTVAPATTTTSPPPETPGLVPEFPALAPDPAQHAPAEAVAQRGDHLWGIAEQALTRQLDRAPSGAEVASYWRRLIEANRSRLVDPSNPDLIYAGQRFELPPL